MKLNSLDVLVIQALKVTCYTDVTAGMIFREVRYKTDGKVDAGGVKAIVKSVTRLTKAGLVKVNHKFGTGIRLTEKGKSHEL